jgi:hypothetical protein
MRGRRRRGRGAIVVRPSKHPGGVHARWQAVKWDGHRRRGAAYGSGTVRCWRGPFVFRSQIDAHIVPVGGDGRDARRSASNNPVLCRISLGREKRRRVAIRRCWKTSRAGDRLRWIGTHSLRVCGLGGIVWNIAYTASFLSIRAIRLPILRRFDSIQSFFCGIHPTGQCT